MKDMRRYICFFMAIISCISTLGQQVKMLTTDSGLSSSLVNALYQDRYGLIWVGTENGLNCYDGVKVQIFRHDDGDSLSLAHNAVRAIVEDDSNHLIVGTQHGIQLFDRENNRFFPPLTHADGSTFSGSVNTLIKRRNGEIWGSGMTIVRLVSSVKSLPVVDEVNLPLPSGFVSYMLEDTVGDLWVAKFNQGIFRLTPEGNMSHYLIGNRWALTQSICEASDGTLYVGTYSNGISCYDRDRDEFRNCELPIPEGTIIRNLSRNGEDELLVCTDNKGLLVLDTDDFSVRSVEMEGCPYDPDKLKYHSAIRDYNNNLWLNVYQKGIMMVPCKRNNFGYVGGRGSRNDLIGSCSVTSLQIGADDELWVGTDNDGIYRIKTAGGGPHSDGDVMGSVHFPVSIDGNGISGTVLDLAMDEDGYIWFGTFRAGLHRLDPSSGRSVSSEELVGEKVFRQSPDAVVMDLSGRLWVGTLGNGLYCIDVRTMEKDPLEEINQSLHRWITDIVVSADSCHLYVATYNGAYRIDIGGLSPVVTGHILPDHIIYSMHECDGILFMGTANGLSVFDGALNPLGKYTKNNGLPADVIYAMEKSRDGDLWVSTASGLSQFSPEAGSFVNFYVGDGLQGNEFCRGASAKDSQGRLYFGGINGMTYFDPADIVKPSSLWSMKITGMETLDGKVSVYGKDSFDIRHQAGNSCQIEFCTERYDVPDGIMYQYSLDDRPWVTLPIGAHSVTLYSIGTGRHDFSVRAMDNGVLSEPIRIRLNVRPAWWESPYALAVYMLMLFGIGHLVYKERKRIKAEELNSERLNSFVNLSHEVRSPMTLIEGPLMKLMETDHNPERQKSYAIMSKSVTRILSLVDRMLDLRKMDEGRMVMHFSLTDINALVSNVCSLFEDYADRKGVILSFRYAGEEDLGLWVDPEYFDKVVVNLVSNAIKFTPPGGSIDISLSRKGDEAVLEVRDTGTGLPEGDLVKIFDRFYQSGNAVSGTGIGLNFSKMIVELHHGTISAVNNADCPGTTFSVHLPIGNAHLSAGEMSEGTASGNGRREQVAVRETVRPGKAGTVLIVDDDPDIRSYVKSELSDLFRVRECRNGREALEQVLTDAPDLVISDVVMPDMDGYTLCHKIRSNINVSTLPVILLSARMQDRDMIEGLGSGADAYIRKPFNIEVLRQTAVNLIDSRQTMKVMYSDRKDNGRGRDLYVRTPDERLLDRVNKVIDTNMGNPSLNVGMVALEVGISRVHLHRKLKELTGQTAHDYVRNIRLRKAAEMLSEKKHSISELAEAVGFSNQANFSTAFKALYGVTPTEYMNRHLPRES